MKLITPFRILVLLTAVVAVLPLRKGVENTAAYGGKEIADQQLKGYPDIKPLEHSASAITWQS